MGTTLHGKNARVYIQGSGAEATLLSEAAMWRINIDSDLAEDNAFGDSWKTNKKGLMGWKGEVTGNFDATETSPFDLALATAPAKFYAYPDWANSGNYYAGLLWANLTVEGSLKEIAKLP